MRSAAFRHRQLFVSAARFRQHRERACRRATPGSLAMFAAIRRASSRASSCAAAAAGVVFEIDVGQGLPVVVEHNETGLGLCGVRSSKYKRLRGRVGLRPSVIGLGNNPPLLLIAPPPAADNAHYFHVAPNNRRVVTNLDHSVHTILDPKNRHRALLTPHSATWGESTAHHCRSWQGSFRSQEGVAHSSNAALEKWLAAKAPDAWPASSNKVTLTRV